MLAEEGDTATPDEGRMAPPVLTLDDLPDAVVVAAVDGTLVAINEVARRSLGIEPADSMGKALTDVLPLVDEDGSSWWEATNPFDALAIVTRQPERLLRMSDGTPVYVTASYVRPQGAGTQLTHLVVSVRRASDRIRRERRATELVATAAHELRSPLTSIRGFTSTLLAKWDRFADEQRRFIVESVRHDAERLSRLVGDLLDVARIDSAKVVLQTTSVDLGAVAHAAVATLVAGGADERRFVIDVAGDVPAITADPDKLMRTVLNLLENALRHGAGQVTIRIDPVDGHEWVGIAVSDAGLGVPDELIDRAFNKYWHAARGSTGLGLYLVRGIVDAHGGSVTLGRAPEGGALIQARLPVGGPNPADRPTTDH